jgi:hypothetical protein
MKRKSHADKDPHSLSRLFQFPMKSGILPLRLLSLARLHINCKTELRKPDAIEVSKTVFKEERN